MTTAISNKQSKRNRRLNAFQGRLERRKALAAALARTALLAGPGANLARPEADPGIGADPGAARRLAAVLTVLWRWVR